MQIKGDFVNDGDLNINLQTESTFNFLLNVYKNKEYNKSLFLKAISIETMTKFLIFCGKKSESAMRNLKKNEKLRNCLDFLSLPKTKDR